MMVSGIDAPLRFHRSDVIVDSPWKTALKFFTEDRSSVGSGSYDAYVMTGGSPPNRITEADVRAINVTMGARSPLADWKSLIERNDLSQLKVISANVDLFLTSEDEWARDRVPERLATLFKAVIGKGIGIARATKLLHIKRPKLIPVCDSYVLGLMGIPDIGADSGVALVEHIRTVRNDLLPTLLALQARLRERNCDRTLVRILDSLLWSGYPDTWIKRR
jgi:hypothetical protein